MKPYLKSISLLTVSILGLISCNRKPDVDFNAQPADPISSAQAQETPQPSAPTPAPASSPAPINYIYITDLTALGETTLDTKLTFTASEKGIPTVSQKNSKDLSIKTSCRVNSGDPVEYEVKNLGEGTELLVRDIIPSEVIIRDTLDVYNDEISCSTTLFKMVVDPNKGESTQLLQSVQYKISDLDTIEAISLVDDRTDAELVGVKYDFRYKLVNLVSGDEPLIYIPSYVGSKLNLTLSCPNHQASIFVRSTSTKLNSFKELAISSLAQRTEKERNLEIGLNKCRVFSEYLEAGTGRRSILASLPFQLIAPSYLPKFEMEWTLQDDGGQSGYSNPHLFHVKISNPSSEPVIIRYPDFNGKSVRLTPVTKEASQKDVFSKTRVGFNSPIAIYTVNAHEVQLLNGMNYATIAPRSHATMEVVLVGLPHHCRIRSEDSGEFQGGRLPIVGFQYRFNFDFVIETTLGSRLVDFSTAKLIEIKRFESNKNGLHLSPVVMNSKEHSNPGWAPTVYQSKKTPLAPAIDSSLINELEYVCPLVNN